LARTVYVDLARNGTPENPVPDSATVTITRQSTGAALHTNAPTVDIDDPAGRFGFTLSPTDTALLDTLTLDWTVTFDSVEQTVSTTVEVVGGFLFSLVELLAVKPNQPNITWTTEEMVQVRTTVEETLEDLCGRAFVPRYRQETLDGTGTATLMLSRPDLRTIRTVTSDDVAYTSEQLALLALRPSGLVYNTGGWWTRGTSNVTVGYEHGLPHPPARVTQAALLLARSWLVKGPIDDRATGQVVGDVSFGLVVPGRNGAHTGIPEVDATIDTYSLAVGVA
jgi:hypothetical protein